MSSFDQSGRYSSVSSTASGMVYLTWLGTAYQHGVLIEQGAFTYTSA